MLLFTRNGLTIVFFQSNGLIVYKNYKLRSLKMVRIVDNAQ